jgi:WD40 repeat protein
VHVISVADGSTLARLPGSDLSARTRLFTPDGRILAVRYHDGDRAVLKVWDVEAETLLFEPDVPVLKGQGFVFEGGTPAPRWLAVGADDETVRLYRLPEGRLWKSMPGGEGIEALACDPAGERLAISAYAESRVSVRRVDDGQLLWSAEPSRGVHWLDWSPDGRLLAGGCNDTLIYLWEFTQHPGVLVSSSWDGTVRIWNYEAMEPLLGPLENCTLSGYQQLMGTLSGSEFALWRLELGGEYRRLRTDAFFGSPSRIAFGPEGRLLVSAALNGVLLWDVQSGEVLDQLVAARANSAHITPDGRTILAAVKDRGLVRWPLQRSGDGIEVGPPETIWNEGRIRASRLQAGGRRIIIIGDFGVRELDLRSGATLLTLPDYQGLATYPSMSRDRRWLFTGNWKGSGARIWDLETLRTVEELPGAHVVGAYSPDGRWLVVGTGPEFLILDAQTRQVQHRLPRAQVGDLAGPIAFSPDGTTIAIAHSRYIIRLVELPSGRLLASLANPHGLSTSTLAYSPDGRLVAAVGQSAVIQVWDLVGLRAQLRAKGLDWSDVP